MKKTIFMLPALALMLFAACSSEDAVTKDNTAQLNETPDNAIGFNAYINRATTRAGKVGVLNNDALQDGVTAGFGVFAYYADGDLYTENATPNFMYNQQVWYNSGWTYEPVKYWPNEFGSQAISTGVDRVTFFAYAPYVAVEPATGQLTSDYNESEPAKYTTSGITSLTRNGKSGDPYVRYVGTFNHANCVDLCYGVAAEAFTSSVGSGDGANSINKGEPYINVAKPAVGSKIYFDFKHALAKLTVNVDADVDIVSHADGEALDGKTRIWVRSITFDGIAQRGYLNLNSGIWYDIMDNNKISHASVTIHDGRRDGSEALSDDTYESPTGFANALVQSGSYTTTVADGTTFPYTSFECSDDTRTGVTSTNQDLFGGDLMVIPANEQLKVTIVYDVETADATLPTYLSDGSTKGSTVENKITKSITLGGSALKLESGKAYTLNLHLGMTSVTFNATVSDWGPGGEANVDLPANAPSASATAANPAESQNLTIPAAATTGVFAVSGLTPGTGAATVVNTLSPTGSWLTSVPAAGTVDIGTDGNLNVTFTVQENNTVKQRTASIAVNGSDSKSAVLNITQQAAALGLSASAPLLKAGQTDIKLDATAKMASDDWTGASITVVRKRGGTTKTLTLNPSSPGADEYKIATTDAGEGDYYATITLGSNAQAGDVYTITVQAGAADPETVSFTVAKQAGSISYATPETPVEVTVSAATTGTTPKTLNKVGDGNVTYSIVKNEGLGTPDIDTNGKVTITSAAEDDIYTVTATVADSDTHEYATKTATYKIKIVPDTP